MSLRLLAPNQKTMESENEVFNLNIAYKQLGMLIISLLINLATVSAIIIPKFLLKKRKDFAISLYLFNFVIFVLCYVLSRTDMSLGAGIGLFAVFSMLRFRSELLKLPDMTYFLVIICIGLVNSIFNSTISFIETIFLNIALCSMVYILDSAISRPNWKCKKVAYDNLDLIKPGKNEELMNDLSAKTGLDILKVRIDSINLQDHIANIMVFFKNGKRTNGNADHWGKFTSLFKRNHVFESN
jgi:hypothetical protein